MSTGPELLSIPLSFVFMALYYKEEQFDHFNKEYIKLEVVLND